MKTINNARLSEYLALMRGSRTVGERALFARCVDAILGHDCPYTAEAFMQLHPDAEKWRAEHCSTLDKATQS